MLGRLCVVLRPRFDHDRLDEVAFHVSDASYTARNSHTICGRSCRRPTLKKALLPQLKLARRIVDVHAVLCLFRQSLEGKFPHTLFEFLGRHDPYSSRIVTSETASRVFRDTMPHSRKPLQVYAAADTALAVHSSTYSRLFDAKVLEAVREAAPDFTPPPTGLGGATGLYAGEQDMFAFGIDPDGWVEIDGENFAPGFFVWNSEVGRRSVGVQTFWYQEICQNHIVWDAIEVVELHRHMFERAFPGAEAVPARSYLLATECPLNSLKNH